MRVSPARTAAFDILKRVETEKAYTSVLLPLYEDQLSPADSGLCHQLVLGCLRRQIYLDRIVDSFARGKRLDTAVRIALRLALYQLYFLDKIPAHSATNESVNLVQRAKKTSAKGFVNAILRRAVTERPEVAFIDETDRIAVETSHPRWLIEKWGADFGLDEAEQIAAVNNEEPEKAFRLTMSGEEGGISVNPNWKPSRFVDDCYIVQRVDTGLRELEKKKQIYFQDEGSQLVAWAVDLAVGGCFLDVCASPGGKTGLVAKRFAGSLKLAVAGDLYWPRVLFLRDNCRRQGATFIKTVQYNASSGLPFAEESFDMVLVDAPCSGTGTIRHNPELRYFLVANDLGDLSGKQLKILTNASKLVKRGGLLGYSTCSLEREENEDVVDTFLARNNRFMKVAPNVPAAFLTHEGFGRTWPHRDRMDGFFIASFRRQ
jgi:16S rRNA (cytosine967-C5)-methyltransferase